MSRAVLAISEQLRDALRAEEKPAFIAVSQWLSAEIRRGRLRPGGRLPSTRELGRALGFNRNTIVAAFAELAAEGWITTRPASGTFVSAALPAARVRRLAAVPGGPGEAAGFELGGAALQLPAAPRPGVRFALWGGIPDLRLVPSAALARAYRRALARSGERLLSYDAPAGLPELRERIAALVRDTRGISAGAEHVLVTRGSQMALYLLARCLLRPGDRVAVEELGYGPAWAAFRGAGAELVPLPVDEHGIDVARLTRQKNIRAVYLTPHHQYPTTATLGMGRRLALLEHARRERIAIIEDDYDHEFHYDGRPILPLASADGGGVVIYLGTLAKVLAPGLRLGFVVAPATLVRELTALRAVVDRQGDHVLEAAVAELYDDDELGRHVRRMRRVYHARRDAFVSALERQLGKSLEFRVPAGGMALWVKSERSAVAWHRRALALGVDFMSGPTFSDAATSSRFEHFARLGFARYRERELDEAVRRLARAYRSTASG